MQHTVDYLKHNQYIDPNHLMGKGGVTFIYTASGNLYTEDSGVSHKEMLEDEKLWIDLLTHPIGAYDKNLAAVPGMGFKRRAFAESYSVLGRTGFINGRDLASFWGSEKNFLLSHIDKCASKLLAGGFVKKNTEVYSLVFEKTTIEKVISKELLDQEENKKEYDINGKVYSWEYLRELRTKTHTDPNKENVIFLCNLLSPSILQKYPELRALVPTRCDGKIHSRPGNLQKYLSAGKAPQWGALYPTIGDSTLHFKHWLLKETK
jgi:hypothetical protein